VDGNLGNSGLSCRSSQSFRSRPRFHAVFEDILNGFRKPTDRLEWSSLRDIDVQTNIMQFHWDQERRAPRATSR
jgi:hypothetical protein